MSAKGKGKDGKVEDGHGREGEGRLIKRGGWEEYRRLYWKGMEERGKAEE